MIEYMIYFLITVFLSSVFAIAGLGSAIALVPILNIFGMPFDISRASGLFVNSITTITTSILNLKKKLFDKDFVYPLVVSSAIFAFIGAKVSLLLPVELVKIIFGYVLLVIASMMLFFKKKEVLQKRASSKLLYVIGSIGGLFSGFLGIGGGSIIAPILFLLGYDSKKVAIGISFVIPFSSVVAFFSYASSIQIDYILLLVIGVGAYLGGRIGNHLLHFKVSSGTIKKILAFSLYVLAFKMILW
jgi:uncharacterized membrane protein YfcA